MQLEKKSRMLLIEQIAPRIGVKFRYGQSKILSGQLCHENNYLLSFVIRLVLDCVLPLHLFAA